MRVEAIALHRVSIPFKHAFGHALKRRTHADTILVVARSRAGAVGLGEIVPRPYLTGETIDSVMETAAPARARRWAGAEVVSRDDLVARLASDLDGAGRELATLGGFELALLDLASKELGFPLSDVLGGEAGPDLPPGVVIGFEVDTPALKKHCALLRLAGRRHIKVKVGRADDLDRLEIIARSLGADLALRLDANGAWPVDDAIAQLSVMRDRFRIESVEQPVAGDDLAGMRRVRVETGLRVMADESLCTADDARRLIDEGAADVFNIRVGKCGGFLGSLRLVQMARAAGIGLHLGALVGETGVLSAAAELFGRHVAGFACIEGKGQSRFLLSTDIVAPVEGMGGLGLQLLDDQVRAHEETHLETAPHHG